MKRTFWLGDIVRWRIRFVVSKAFPCHATLMICKKLSPRLHEHQVFHTDLEVLFSTKERLRETLGRLGRGEQAICCFSATELVDEAQEAGCVIGGFKCRTAS